MVITRDSFFYPILTRIKDSLSFSPLNIPNLEKMKKASKNPEYAEMRHGDGILILQLHHGSTCGQRLAVLFFIFP